MKFEVAGGSVIGRDHALAGRNNQDAFGWWVEDGALAAVVTDGCGSGRHSEIGAQLGSRLVLEALRRHAPLLGAWPADAVLESVRRDVLGNLRQVATALGGRLADTVEDSLLFTVVGALVTPAATVAFSLGDGVTVVNGYAEHLAFPDNAPPYLAYGLTGSLPPDPCGPRFVVRHAVATSDLGSLVVATDGLGRVPPPLSVFWKDDLHFCNPAAVERRLRRINSAAPRPLTDDTTLVVVRRRP